MIEKGCLRGVLQLCTWNNVPLGRQNTKAVPVPWSINRRFAFTYFETTLQRHNAKNSNKYSQKRNWAASVPISTFKCLWAIYLFPWSVCLFCCRKIYGPILGIQKLLTNTWLWKLGLWPRSFSGNTQMGFSLQCSTKRRFTRIVFFCSKFSSSLWPIGTKQFMLY